ncbi:uncharacterized protein LY79DRAFT_539378 [Colletotrichum navitas]|uniref:C3H1-type domain-containing protein n=1 Tax=Colletotrichum navitas TaxID=681940 RepID=A0AAD8Q931_9PEZI|nr:uncharacterized protein LY79DRAFT_539378 [Colletotrichum navitas]KAK1597879.1 hypothetical protein LY79DRAFT_539378 [Colletotrichum navitas]
MSQKASFFSGQSKMHAINSNRRGLSRSIHNPQTDNDWQLRPRHFIVREGGTIVPLVPIDQLPAYIKIHGVPREMGIEDTIGMSNLGMFTKPEGVFQICPLPPTNDKPSSSVGLSQSDPSALDNHTCSQQIERLRGTAPEPMFDGPVTRWVSEFVTGDSRVPPSRPTMATETTQPQPPAPELTAPRVVDWAEDTESVSTDNFSATDEDRSASSTPNTAVIPVKESQTQQVPTPRKEKSAAEVADRMVELGDTQCTTRQDLSSRTRTQSSICSTVKPPRSGKQKVPRPAGSLCRHWCQTGQCSWGTECRYTHQMPVTLEGLADVGLTELPGWWRRAAGLPVKGTIDVRIFAAAASAATGGGKKNPSPTLTPGTTVAVPVHQSKKARSKIEREERKMAEEVHAVRLGLERAQATASKEKLGLGQAQAQQIQAGNVQQLYEEVEKLVDI